MEAKRTGVSDIGLLEGDEVLVLVDGELGLVEASDLVENLISDADLGGELVLEEVHDQVTANEAGATEDEDAVTHGLCGRVYEQVRRFGPTTVEKWGRGGESGKAGRGRKGKKGRTQLRLALTLPASFAHWKEEISVRYSSSAD